MPQVDMDLIREAMLRRRAEGGNVGGAGMPMSSQTTMPTATTPTGGPNTPIEPSATPSGVPGGASAIPPEMGAEMKKTAQQGQSAQFDDETRVAAKTLLQKLLKYL